jgi:RNA polymerase sigma-70 factor (ECF subfamily)
MTSQDDELADVARAAAGDRGAFERLYRLHISRVFTLCMRMVGDRARAEELAQDVFIRAWEKLGQFRGGSAFGTWLHRVAVNVVLNDRATERKARERFDDTDALDRKAGAEQSEWTHGTRIDLEAAIARLPPGARRVFVLHDVEGYTHEEIGTMLGVTAGSSKAQLHRARLLLRKLLLR